MRWALLAILVGCGARATPEVDVDPLEVAVKAKIKERSHVFRSCKRHWVKGRDGGAKLQLALTVSTTGVVDTASLSSKKTVDDTFLDCLRDEASTWNLDVELRAPRTLRVPLPFAP